MKSAYELGDGSYNPEKDRTDMCYEMGKNTGFTKGQIFSLIGLIVGSVVGLSAMGYWYGCGTDQEEPGPGMVGVVRDLNGLTPNICTLCGESSERPATAKMPLDQLDGPLSALKPGESCWVDAGAIRVDDDHGIWINTLYPTYPVVENAGNFPIKVFRPDSEKKVEVAIPLADFTRAKQEHAKYKQLQPWEYASSEETLPDGTIVMRTKTCIGWPENKYIYTPGKYSVTATKHWPVTKFEKGVVFDSGVHKVDLVDYVIETRPVDEEKE